MKKWIVLMFIVFLLMPITVQAVDMNEEEWMQEYDFTELDETVEDLFPEEKMNFQDTVTELISGETKFSFDMIKNFFWDQLSYEIRANKNSMIHILVLVIIAAIFANFSGIFSGTQVSEIGFLTIYMLLITICLNMFRIMVDSVADNVQRLTSFMDILSPVYFLSVAFATGSSTSIAFYHIVLLLIYIVEIFICHFLIPLTQIYLVMRILGEMSTEIHLTKFSELIETIVSWSLKTLLALIVGLNLIQGLLNPAIDSVKRGLLTKGGEAIPVIGDAIAGSTEIVLGSAVLIKNGIGVAGMMFSILICLVPLVQMAVSALMYQLTAALIQPISDKRLVNCISAVASGAKMLLRIVFTTAVLFMLTIAVVAATIGG